MEIRWLHFDILDTVQGYSNILDKFSTMYVDVWISYSNV